MPKITRSDFVRDNSNKRLDVNEALGDRRVRRDLEQGGVGTGRIRGADLNRDGFVSGNREMSKLFSAIDVADRNGDYNSIRTERSGVATASGRLLDSVEARMKEGAVPERLPSPEGLSAERVRELENSVPRIMRYKDAILRTAEKYDLPPELIAGTIFQESRGKNVIGDNGHGHGLMQIDDGWHQPWLSRNNNGLTPSSNIDYGASLIARNRTSLRGEGLDGNKLMRASMSAYNSGLGRVKSALRTGRDVDFYTTGKDYGEKVMTWTSYFKTKHPEMFD